jgi:hypothetical protein
VHRVGLFIGRSVMFSLFLTNTSMLPKFLSPFALAVALPSRASCFSIVLWDFKKLTSPVEESISYYSNKLVFF